MKPTRSNDEATKLTVEYTQQDTNNNAGRRFQTLLTDIGSYRDD